MLTQYWVYLLVISLAFVVFERIRPWRQQSVLRPAILTDMLYLTFNGHFLALILAPMALRITPEVEAALVPFLGRGHIASLPLWIQGLIAFFVIDFIKWCVHVMLHNVSFLWAFHKVHHSIVTMDWVGSMRFHWLEIVIYDSVLYLPMLLFGFDWRLLLGLAVFSTFMGHFNHSNLKVDLGPLRYLINHPGMHIWHHDLVLHFKAGCNFGINLSLWDWIFGTAYLPADLSQPKKLGFPGLKKFPKDFISQQLFPLSTALTRDATRAQH